MIESQPNDFETIKEQVKQEMIALTIEISESGEKFPFTNIDEVSYAKIKTTCDEYPDYATPIEDIVSRLKNEGMKVVLSDDPKSGNVYILPALSEDVLMDNIFPRDLQTNEEMDSRLKKLIEINKRWKDMCDGH